MEDLARLTQKWKDSHPLKEWRRRKGYLTQQAALVLDVNEARILHLRHHPRSLDQMGTCAPAWPAGTDAGL
jgi:hypothetical protein